MDFQINELEKDVVIEATDDEGNVEAFSLKALINAIIAFINKLIKFEF